jgi:three-Cys-motif partner protein
MQQLAERKRWHCVWALKSSRTESLRKWINDEIRTSTPGTVAMNRENRDEFEEIGPWTEVKHEIVRKYGAAYSRILAAQQRPSLAHVYVDAFAGAGRYISRKSGLLVPGTPEIALTLQPPFREYHLIDIDDVKVAQLERIAENRHDVTIHRGDCNTILVNDVLPAIRYEHYRRGLCILDPYGLHLAWETVAAVAAARSTEIFLNFPMMDINRNALRRDPERIEAEQARRMTRFWVTTHGEPSSTAQQGNLICSGLSERTR